MKIIVSRKTYNKIMNAIDVADFIIKTIIGVVAFYGPIIITVLLFG